MAKVNNFTQRIITGSIFLMVMIGSIIWSFPSMVGIFALVIVVASYEYARLTSSLAYPSRWLIIFINLLSFLLIAGVRMLDLDISSGGKGGMFMKAMLINLVQVLSLFFFPILIMVIELFRKKDNAFSNIAYSVFGYFYISVPFSLLIQISNNGVWSHYKYGIILAFFTCIWVNDSFAYVWGKLLGRHKLAPKISAGKTIEGTIGGIISTAGFAFLLPILFPTVQLNQVQWILFAGLTALFAVPGDLAESILKRQVGVKDSGSFLPGHGGVLDRFDSVLLAAPIIFVFLKTINMI